TKLYVRLAVLVHGRHIKSVTSLYEISFRVTEPFGARAGTTIDSFKCFSRPVVFLRFFHALGEHLFVKSFRHNLSVKAGSAAQNPYFRERTRNRFRSFAGRRAQWSDIGVIKTTNVLRNVFEVVLDSEMARVKPVDLGV